MRAESIEQIREHLARGGRVETHMNGPFTDEQWVAMYAITDALVCNARGVQIAIPFERVKPDGWELLPIDEEEPLLGWRDAGTISSKEPLSFRQATNRRMKILIDGEDTGAGERIRTALLYGRKPEMADLLAWWQATTGERIEHGERCKACECSGVFSVYGKEVHCIMCNGSGYTVRPTWMEAGK